MMETVDSLQPDQCARCYLLGHTDYFPDPGGSYFCEAHCLDNATKEQYECIECILSYLANSGNCPFYVNVDNRYAKKVK